MSRYPDGQRAATAGHCLRPNAAMIALTVLGVLLSLALCLGADTATAGENAVLHVPAASPAPVIDGTLDDPLWQQAARTGTLPITGVTSDGNSTEAFLLRDADHLYIALRCVGKLKVAPPRTEGEPASAESFPMPLALHAGSFIQVDQGLPADQPLVALTVECWYRPRQLHGWQTLIAQHNYPNHCGYGLFVDGEGRLQFYLSDGTAYRPERVLSGPIPALNTWQHVVGTWDGHTKSLWVNGELAAQEEFEGPVQAGTAPLWLGACGHNGAAVNHVAGELAMPAIYSQALSAEQVCARAGEQGRTPATGETVLACWPSVDELGELVADCSPNARHGRVIVSAAAREFVDLLIDSNADRKSCYLIRMSPEGPDHVICSYVEHSPPWHDRTWQPDFPFVVVRNEHGWTAECALPLEIFSKNKTLAADIGFNVRRFRLLGHEVHCWQGAFEQPEGWGTLTGFTPRDQLPVPEYATRGLNRFYRPPNRAGREHLAEPATRTTVLTAGSAHPGTSGKVRLEFEGFLLAGDPHARGIIWDLAVDETKGELYVLSDTRPVRGVAEVRVFDRDGQYLRTVMPLNPTLSPASVQDVCRTTARELGTQLVVPKLFHPWGEPSFYGDWWHHPQKMVLASNGDLIMANIYKGILWRIRPDGSLPPEGWTSLYHAGRNEPFESTAWTQDMWMVPDLKNYLPFHALHYPYFCFDRAGALFISAGQSTRPTRQYAYHFEVSHQEVSYHREVPEKTARGECVWKCQLTAGPAVEEQQVLRGFAEPSGLVHDGDHLIVADSGHNRLLVLRPDGGLAATITHYVDQGEQQPIHGPTAVAMDHQAHLYVLVASTARSPDRPIIERTLPLVQEDYLRAAQTPCDDYTKVIKLKSWQDPQLLAASAPLHRDVLQISLDAGTSPPLVWVANGAGWGSLLQLGGDELTTQAQWGETGDTLRCPRQSGNLPILNIDPHTGDLYVEDNSDYRLKQHGTVYRLDQEGNVLRKWAPYYFNDLNLPATSPWWTLDYERHFRYPDEPLFIDSIFGQDGRVYRWRLSEEGVELLRFDRDGNPIPFAATGSHALFVDYPMHVGFWHDVCHGMDVDRHGNIYYVAKVDVEPERRPVAAEEALRRQVNVYNADGELVTRGLLRLDAVRGLQVDEAGNLYVLHRPVTRPWEDYLALEKFPAAGGEPLWSRPWHSYYGWAQVANPPCHCTAFRLHQVLDGRGYLYAAGKFSVQVIDTETGALAGEFGSYGNWDCQGKGSTFPHPELPFGTIAALSVWQDRLFAVDVVNRRIVKCRIRYADAD